MAFYPKAALAVFALLLLPAVATAQPRALTGPETVRPATDEYLDWAASVVGINELRGQGALTAKLFGTAGGDPAMNGLYTYLAFYASPQDGWRVFQLGDFLTYRIVSETPGRVVIEVNENVMDEASGNIGSRTRRFAVSWTPGPDGAPPASVTMAPLG